MHRPHLPCGVRHIRLGPALALAHEDVIIGPKRGQGVIHQPGGLGGAKLHIAGIGGADHRHAKVHRLDHPKAPAFGFVQRHIAVAAGFELQQILIAKGLVHHHDARVILDQRIHLLPDGDLHRIGHLAAVLGLDQQAHARHIRKRRLERPQRAQRVLALDEGKAVESHQKHEFIRPEPRQSLHESAGIGAVDLGQLFKAHADIGDRAVEFRLIDLHAVIGGYPDLVQQFHAKVMAGGGGVQLPEEIADVIGTRKHIGLIGKGQRDRFRVQMDQVDLCLLVARQRADPAKAFGGRVIKTEVDRIHRQAAPPQPGQHRGRKPGGLPQPRGFLERADQLQIDAPGAVHRRQHRGLKAVALGGEGHKTARLQIKPLQPQDSGIIGAAQDGGGLRRHLVAEPRKGRQGGRAIGQHHPDIAGRQIAQIIRALCRHHHQCQQQLLPAFQPVQINRGQHRGLGMDALHEMAGGKGGACPAIGDRRQLINIALRHQTIFDMQRLCLVDRPPVHRPAHPFRVLELRRVQNRRHAQQERPGGAAKADPLAKDHHRGVEVIQHRLGNRHPQATAQARIMRQKPAKQMLGLGRVAVDGKAIRQFVTVEKIFGIAGHQSGRGPARKMIGGLEQGLVPGQRGLRRPCPAPDNRVLGRNLGQTLQLRHGTEQKLRQISRRPAGRCRNAVRMVCHPGVGQAGQIDLADVKRRIAEGLDPHPPAIGPDRPLHDRIQRNVEPAMPGPDAGLDHIIAVDIGGGLRDQPLRREHAHLARTLCRVVGGNPAHQRMIDIAVDVAPIAAKLVDNPAKPPPQRIRQAHHDPTWPSSAPDRAPQPWPSSPACARPWKDRRSADQPRRGGRTSR